MTCDSADVLRNTAGFAIGDMGRPDRIEQRRLAVIDVAHDRDHGRTRHLILRFFGQFHFPRGFFFEAQRVGGRAETRAPDPAPS